MRPRSFALLLVILGFLTSDVCAATFVVITNERNSMETVSVKELSLMFLKRKTQWPGGSKIIPVALPGEAPASLVFDHEILGKSRASLRAYWQQEIFSGRSVPPSEQGSDQAVITFVRRNSGAIGYVSTTASLTGVKVLKVVK